MVQVTTQIYRPKGDTKMWCPIETFKGIYPQINPGTTAERYIITHRSAFECYQHSIPKHITIDCVGKKTQSLLDTLGYTTIRYDSADDIIIDGCFDYVWLHGDRYRQDFSPFPNVTAIHTYSTQRIDDNLAILESIEIEKLWVYSSNAMEILDRSIVKADRLYVPPSVWVDSIRWKKITRFNP